MNAVHSSASSDAEIVEMRDLLERIDAGVADAYGWSDLDLTHSFQDDSDDRDAISSHYSLDEQTRDLVLAKLIELNRQLYEATASVSGVGKERPKSGKGRRRASLDVGSLFEDTRADEKSASASPSEPITY